MCEIKIKEIREKLGLTQQEFAKNIGVHYKTIQNWEAGRPIPESKKAILSKIIDNNPIKSDYEKESDDNLRALIEILKITLTEKDKQIDRLLSIIEQMNKK
ncbi:MAG: helix-turn-helix domain-containing protein [Bacteroidales bacterium]|nr:helix-turn-helix domain-containing protein [Bacteroidales bacterium]